MNYLLLLGLLASTCGLAQEVTPMTTEPYKKRVLETSELQILTSYYQQDGQNAAVTGGRGTEYLTDVHPTVILATPLSDDDVLTASVGISAYTSASSSNVDPFDGDAPANPFQASSGASSSDVWMNAALTYTHSSDDRNTLWSGTLSGSNEYDYKSFGVGGSYTRLMNAQNTELTLRASTYQDGWKLIYPIELREREGLLGQTGRQSYALGVNLSQIVSSRMQGMLSLDLVQQNGLLSTPFQRVYFVDVADRFREDFPLADDIERLPDARTKLAVGGRLHTYLNERLVLRTFYRYYVDDWGIASNTLSVELPVKLGTLFTVRPGYRYYDQTAADYFAPYNAHLSTEKYYTSDYDLAQFTAGQYSLGLSYTDILTQRRVLGWNLKRVDVDGSLYRRNNGFQAVQFAVGVQVVHN